MAESVNQREFDNFRTAITDPDWFFGRRDLLDNIVFASSPQVHILLGGRRIGKTSLLRAIEWNMFDTRSQAGRRSFPVFISLDVEQPRSLDNFRYVLMRRLRDAIDRWRHAAGSTLRALYRSYLSQVASAEVSLGSLLRLKVVNPDADRTLGHDDFREALINTITVVCDLGFDGVLFLLDEADYIVRTPWANHAWSYLRGLKDTDMAIKPFLGVILSGYRDLKEYEQRVGSPLLNISDIRWLGCLKNDEVTALLSHRFRNESYQLTDGDVDVVFTLTGGHPFLVQQVANAIIDRRDTPIVDAKLRARIVRRTEIDGTFSSWWNEKGKSDGFGPAERSVYRALVDLRSADEDLLARHCGLSVSSCVDALVVLAGTGVIRSDGDDRYEVGGQLFEDWTRRLVEPLAVAD